MNQDPTDRDSDPTDAASEDALRREVEHTFTVDHAEQTVDPGPAQKLPGKFVQPPACDYNRPELKTMLRAELLAEAARQGFDVLEVNTNVFGNVITYGEHSTDLAKLVAGYRAWLLTLFDSPRFGTVLVWSWPAIHLLTSTKSEPVYALHCRLLVTSTTFTQPQRVHCVPSTIRRAAEQDKTLPPTGLARSRCL